MAAQFPCPECEAEIGPRGTRCKACGWEARKPPELNPERKHPGHDSNPNDPICQSCHQPNASIYPGVLRGGGKGYCSECYRRMRAGGFSGQTVEGTSFAQDIQDLLKSTRERIDARRRKHGQKAEAE